MPLVLNNCHIDYGNSLTGNLGQFNVGDNLVRRGTNSSQSASSDFHNNALGVNYGWIEFVVKPDDGYMIQATHFEDKTQEYYNENVGINPNLVNPELWLHGPPTISTAGNDMDPDTTDGDGWSPFRTVKVRYNLNNEYIIGSSNEEFVIDFGNTSFLPSDHRQVCIAVVEDMTSMVDACDGCGKNYPLRIKNVIPASGVKYMNQWNQEDIDSAGPWGGLSDLASGFQLGTRFNLPLYGPENITYNNDNTVYWNGAKTNTIQNNPAVNAVDYVHYFSCITNVMSSETRHIATFEVEIDQNHHDSEAFLGFINASNYGPYTTETPTQVVTESGEGHFHFDRMIGLDGRHVFLQQDPQHTVDKILGNYPNCYDIQTISYVDTSGNEQTAVTGFKFDIYWDEPDVGTNIPTSVYQENYVPYGFVQYYGEQSNSGYLYGTAANFGTNVINPALPIALNPFTNPHANWNQGDLGETSYEEMSGDFSLYSDGFNLGTMEAIDYFGGDISILGEYGFLLGPDSISLLGQDLFQVINFDQFRIGWHLGTRNSLVQSSTYITSVPSGTGYGAQQILIPTGFNSGINPAFIGSGYSGGYSYMQATGQSNQLWHYKVFPAKNAEVIGHWNWESYTPGGNQVVQYPWLHPDYTVHIKTTPRSSFGVVTTVTDSTSGSSGAFRAPSFTTALKPTSKFKIKRVDIDSKRVHGTNAYNIISATGIAKNNVGTLVKIVGTPGARFKVSLVESKNLEIIDLGGGIEGERSAGYNSGSGVELEGGVIPLMPEGVITIPRSGLYKFNLPYIEALTATDGWKEFDFKVSAELDSTILKSAARNKDAEIILNDVEVIDGVDISSPFDGNTLAIKMYQYPNVSVKLTATKDAGWDYVSTAYNIDSVTEVGKSKTKRDGIPLGKVDQTVKVDIRLKKLNSTFTLNKLNTTEVIDVNDGTTVVAYRINNDVIKAKVEDNKDNVTLDLYAHLGQGVGSSNVDSDYVTVYGTMNVRSYGLKPQEYDIDLTEVFNNS